MASRDQCSRRRRRHWGGWTDVENSLGLPPRLLIVPLRVGDELFGEALGLLCLGVGGLDMLVGDERRDEAAEEGLSRRRVTAQMPVLDETTRHLVVLYASWIGLGWVIGWTVQLKCSEEARGFVRLGVETLWSSASLTGGPVVRRALSNRCDIAFLMSLTPKFLAFGRTAHPRD